MKSIVISDTSPLITLMKSGNLDFCKKLFNTVYVPTEVYKELTQNPKFQIESETIKSSPFIRIMNVNNKMAVSELLKNNDGIHKGEAEAIILAKEKDATLIIDEKKGREIAKKNGLEITGSTGVFAMAYSNRLITASDLLISVDKLEKSNIHLSAHLTDFLRALPENIKEITNNSHNEKKEDIESSFQPGL